MRQPTTDDDTPRDLDELMRRLRRRIGAVDRRAMHCESRQCRRARYCLDAALCCAELGPAPPTTAAQNAEMRAPSQQTVRADRQSQP